MPRSVSWLVSQTTTTRKSHPRPGPPANLQQPTRIRAHHRSPLCLLLTCHHSRARIRHDNNHHDPRSKSRTSKQPRFEWPTAHKKGAKLRWRVNANAGKRPQPSPITNSLSLPAAAGASSKTPPRLMDEREREAGPNSTRLSSPQSPKQLTRRLVSSRLRRKTNLPPEIDTQVPSHPFHSILLYHTIHPRPLLSPATHRPSL